MKSLKTEICGVLVESETNKKFQGKKYQKLWNTANSTSFAPVKTEHKKFVYLNISEPYFQSPPRVKSSAEDDFFF